MNTGQIIAKLKEEAWSTDYEFLDAIRGWSKFEDLPLEFVAKQNGDEARWGSRDLYIHRVVPTGDLIAIEIYEGATEDQESQFEGSVYVVEAEEVTITRYVKPASVDA